MNKKTFFKWFEAVVWISGILYLAFFVTPNSDHFIICPISKLGFDFCPGCGLGNSVSLIFSGSFIQSFYVHPLGFFALIVMLLRIYKIIEFNLNHSKEINLTERENHA